MKSFLDRSLAYFCGSWQPLLEVQISVSDQGFRQGITAVERLRTYSGRLFEVDRHLRRWTHTTEQLRIEGLPQSNQIKEIIRELMHRNSRVITENGDIGVTLFATPGDLAVQDARPQNSDSFPPSQMPTLGIHLSALDLHTIDKRSRVGQPLVVTDVCHVPNQCWSRSLKVRSRIQYYLADRFAHDEVEDGLGVLVDSDGTVTETSIANLAIVESNRIISPESEQVLPGVTQAVIETLAIEHQLVWQYERISIDRFVQSDEVLCMGTSGGIWFASSVRFSPETRRSNTCEPEKLTTRAFQRGHVFDRLKESFAAYVVDVSDIS